MHNYILVSFVAYDANAGSSPYSVGIPAMTSISGFVDAVKHVAGLLDTHLPIDGFVFGYDNPKIVGHEQRYKILLNVPRNTVDPSDMAPPPSPRISARFHVILCMSGGDVDKQVGDVAQVMRHPSIRFCGGAIDTTAKVHVRSLYDTNDLWSGQYIQDATHELALASDTFPELTPLERMVLLCHRKDDQGLRRYPNSLGFLSLENSPTLRETRYGQQLHVYAEPAVGIVKEVHSRHLKIPSISLDEALLPITFRKTFDARGSMYLKHPN